MVLVSFSSKELVRKLDERRAAEDSYCSFEALELGFAALQSGRDGAEVGRQYGVHGGAQKRLWAEDHRLHGEHLQQGASERFCARVCSGVVERSYTPPRGGYGPPPRKYPRQPPQPQGALTQRTPVCQVFHPNRRTTTL